MAGNQKSDSLVNQNESTTKLRPVCETRYGHGSLIRGVALSVSASGAWPLRRQPLISRPIAISYFNNVSDGSEGRRCVAADVSVRVCFFFVFEIFLGGIFFRDLEGGRSVRAPMRTPAKPPSRDSLFFRIVWTHRYGHGAHMVKVCQWTSSARPITGGCCSCFIASLLLLLLDADSVFVLLPSDLVFFPPPPSFWHLFHG